MCMFGGMATKDGSIADMLQHTTFVLQIAAVTHLQCTPQAIRSTLPSLPSICRPEGDSIASSD